MSEEAGLGGRLSSWNCRIQEYGKRKLYLLGQKPIPSELYVDTAVLFGLYHIGQGAIAYRDVGRAHEAVKFKSPDLEALLWTTGLRHEADVEWAMRQRNRFMRGFFARSICFVGAWWLFVRAVDGGYFGSFRLP